MSRIVVVAMEITMAVSTKACGSGSDRSAKAVREGNASPRQAPMPVASSVRLEACPNRDMPKMMRTMPRWRIM